jgi:hypothetical protein
MYATNQKETELKNTRKGLAICQSIFGKKYPLLTTPGFEVTTLRTKNLEQKKKQFCSSNGGPVVSIDI